MHLLVCELHGLWSSQKFLVTDMFKSSPAYYDSLVRHFQFNIKVFRKVCYVQLHSLFKLGFHVYHNAYLAD